MFWWDEITAFIRRDGMDLDFIGAAMPFGGDMVGVARWAGMAGT